MNIKAGIKKNLKIFENYFFMTFLQGANLLIGLLLYPYLIRVLGQYVYGTYVFASSIVTFFSIFISFGFTFPALKRISLNRDDLEVKRTTVATVFTAKSILFVISGIIFSLLIFLFPLLREHYLLYFILYTNLLAEVLFPIWYFQGIQRMRIVTIIQLATKVFSIPFIFIFIKSASDLTTYAIIFSLTLNVGAVISVLYLRIKEKISLYFVPLRDLKKLFVDSLPFFWTSAVSVLKKESVTFIIGLFFGMKDVALYDLANKIITIPRLLTMSINDAIFPAVVKNTTPQKVRKILNYERIISLVIILVVLFAGYWIVLLLGGKEMTASYPIAILLSTTIYSWLVVGGFINYVFVPQNRYYFVAKNQFLSLIMFLFFCVVFLILNMSIFSVVMAYALSGIVEIFYCRFLIRKHQLL